MSAFKEQLIAIAAGKTDNEFETSKQTLAGEKINIWARWHVVPGYEQSLSRIFIATMVDELNLDKDQAIALFRIFQESLTNIARHAKASQVKAKIAKRDRALWIEITDNGKGISAEALNATSKFGLLGMRERALVFGGEVIVTGTPGQGTTVTIKVPNSDEKRV